MVSKVISLKIAGPAGLGIKSIGLTLSKILIDHKFYTHDYSEYPSLVRGGHNTYQLSFSADEIFAPFYQLDYLVTVAPDHDKPHLSELKTDGVVISASSNTFALGALGFIFDLNFEIVKNQLALQYPKAIEANLKIYQEGFDFASKNFKQNKIGMGNNQSHVSLHDGNEAFGWGFIKAGGNFYAAYPMTPATGTLHFLAEKQKEFKHLTVVHPEDEISAANMVVGAAFAGARAATGTSGGGFALMNEAISFAAVSEIGEVFYLVSRPGPATGLPTWTSQGDLLHAVFSGHGEFPLVVLAPGDQQESFDVGKTSLNLAAKLQTPVIVISDKFAAESASSVTNLSEENEEIISPKTFDKVPDNYQRYDTNVSDGISSYTIPGTPDGQFLANSYEHSPSGFSTEDALTTQEMVDKRFRKLQTALSLTPKAEIYGNEKAENLIVSFGSTKGPILEALRILGDKFAFLQIKTIWPIDPNLKFIFDSFKNTIVIENDKTAQLVTILKSQFDFNPVASITKYDGRPFFPEELATDLIKCLKIEN